MLAGAGAGVGGGAVCGATRAPAIHSVRISILLLKAHTDSHSQCTRRGTGEAKQRTKKKIHN